MAGTWIDEHGLRRRLPGLPLILCGPVLGRTEPGSVTVWIALKVAMTVTLRIYIRFEPGSEGQLTEKVIGARSTVPLGESLHIAAVTATPSDGPLVAGQLYFYDLFFSASPVAVPVPETATALRSPGITQPSSGPPLDDLEPSNLSYSQEWRLPSFSLPPNELNKLRLVNCSCRKPDGNSGLDAMPILDELLTVDWPVADDRPHQLLLTGDQVYADGSTDVFLFLLVDTARALLGWEEPLPGVNRPEELLPGKRERVVKELAGLTTEDPENHVLRLGEFLALHLLGWSNVLWPETFPPFTEVRPDLPPGKKFGHQDRYEANVARLRTFRDTLPPVRRALANVPTYMLFDDHDVTDDWNMYRDWAERVYIAPLGRRVVQNGGGGGAAWGVEDRCVGCGVVSAGSGRQRRAAGGQYRGVVPPAAGRHVFGPVARIVWGTPTLITIDVCLVLELPAPVRLVVLGRLRAVLPDEREAIVRIQMDLLGVVDFDRREAAVDATLVDSRLAQFALTGDMAMRMS